ncbi:hypothetical protein RHMOL_Rhmol10G0264900 [Rhododendron molle]|uniref:Uncharacterized protein n=1 Tax=Rhododendron molle TaxID=49168 RepID=A0ACC0M6Z1_RHOML|nr:hypothetical protein RHMOL_Rhmol10G0264900 [Rhododendron molle]
MPAQIYSRAAIDSVRRARLRSRRIVVYRSASGSSGVRAAMPFVLTYLILAMAMCNRMEWSREEREEEYRKLGAKREALHQIHNDLITIKEGLNRGFWARFFSSR